MKTILFNKSGGPLKFKFVVKNGALSVDYSISISEKIGVQPIAKFEGNNSDSHKENCSIPTLSTSIESGLLRIKADFRGIVTDICDHYLMGLEVYQGEKLLETIEKDGDLSHLTQSILLFAQLKVIPETA